MTTYSSSQGPIGGDGNVAPDVVAADEIRLSSRRCLKIRSATQPEQRRR